MNIIRQVICYGHGSRVCFHSLPVILVTKRKDINHKALQLISFISLKEQRNSYSVAKWCPTL